jgi:hypothetical protein
METDAQLAGRMKDVIEVMVMTNWDSVSLNPEAQVNKADHLHFHRDATFSQPASYTATPRSMNGLVLPAT